MVCLQAETAKDQMSFSCILETSLFLSLKSVTKVLWTPMGASVRILICSGRVYIAMNCGENEIGRLYDPHFSSPSDLSISNLVIFVLNVPIRWFPNNLHKRDSQKYVWQCNMKPSSRKLELKLSDSVCLLSRLPHMSRCKNQKKDLLSKNK